MKSFRIKYLIVVFILISFFGRSQNAFQNSGNFRLHTGTQIGFFGDLTNNGTMTSNLGEIHLVGSALQNINGSNKVQSHDLIVNNANNIKLDNQLEVSNTLAFTNGLINSDRTDVATEFVHFLAGSSYSGSSNASHINGAVRKTGNTAFTFPVGDDANLQAVSISAPSLGTDHFTVFYTENSATLDGYDTGLRDFTGLDHVSNCEWWQVNRTGGSSNVSLALDFDANSCGVTDLSDLIVTHWNGSLWQSLGNGGTTGTTTSGTVQTSGLVSSFSPFTIGSSTSNNPLPVQLLSFDVELKNQNGYLTWQTLTEINNDYFQLERSMNAQEWQVINIQQGAGNSNELKTYHFIDETLTEQALYYYRLKQVDYDDQYSYSDIKSLSYSIDNSSNELIKVFPNPIQDDFFFLRNQSDENLLISYKLYDSTSKLLAYGSTNLEKAIDFSIIYPAGISGVYLLHIFKDDELIKTEKLIVD